MATTITSECINCSACEPECPNTAIYQGGIEWEFGGQKHQPLATDIFYIVPEKCTECVGFHDQEACAAVCPVDCCVPDPNLPESEEALLDRARKLHPEATFGADFPSRFRKQSAGAPPAAAPAASAPPEPAPGGPAEAATAKPAAAPAAAVSPPKPAPPTAPAAPAAAPAAAPQPASVDAQPQAAAAFEAVPATILPALDQWGIPIACRSCAGEYTVAFRHVRPGMVLHCPHCHGSFVPSRSTYLGIAAVLERFSSRWQGGFEEFREKLRREIEEFEDRLRAFTRDGQTATGKARRRWFG